jgi:hypothetical protein
MNPGSISQAASSGISGINLGLKEPKTQPVAWEGLLLLWNGCIFAAKCDCYLDQPTTAMQRPTMNEQAEAPEKEAPYEKPEFEVLDLQQVIRGIGGSNVDGDNTPTRY